MKIFNNFPFRDHRYGLILLRTYLALAMLLHGVAKVQNGVGGIEGMLVSNGLPGFIAYGVYIGEVLAPLAMVFGLFVVPAALVIAVNMLFAIGLAHASHVFALTKTGGWAIELQVFYLVAALTVAMTAHVTGKKFVQGSATSGA